MTEVKVKFLPEGGFNKNGAFIEYDGDSPTGQETEFQRQSYLTLHKVKTFPVFLPYATSS